MSRYRHCATSRDDKSDPFQKYPTCTFSDRLLGGSVIDESFSHGTAVNASLYLKHSELHLECKKQVAKEAFQEYDFCGNLPQNLRAMTGRILSRWGDAGWGHVVADDKHAGHFRDELVDAVVEMVRERWKPDPTPAWITCVPSRNHSELVPDLCRRLAKQLEVPFLPVVTKTRDNQPQKMQQNRFHQCRNLDGAFDVGPDIPSSPVLLVDDMVDSVWTMTIVAALLRKGGSGPVWPVALATTSAGD